MRQKRFLIRGAKIVVPIILLAISIVLFFRHVFILRVISITGAENISRDHVQALVDEKLYGDYLWFFPRRNALLYPKSEIATALTAEFPQLSSVGVSLIYPLNLSLTLTERSPLFSYCGAEQVSERPLRGCFLVDETGYVYSKSITLDSPYPELYAPLRAEGEPLRNFVLSADDFKNLKALTLYVITSHIAPRVIEISPDRSAEISTNVGWKIKFLLDDSADMLAKNLSAALSSDVFSKDPDALASLDYLDLRFGNKVYYKWKNR